MSRSSARLCEVQVNLESARTLRSFASYQQALNNVAYLSNILPLCEEVGLEVGTAVKQELSNVLWAKGELLPSIHVLRSLVDGESQDRQTIPVGKAGLLATLVSSV